MSHKSVYIFLLEIFMWLPITFFIWYYLATPLTAPVALLVHVFLSQLFLPTWIEGIEQHGHLLQVITSIKPTLNIAVPAGTEAILIFDVNPLIYSYSLPFFMALSFAVPHTTVIQKLRQVSLTWLLILLPVQAFCVIILILQTLIFQTEPNISFQIVSNFWFRELIALIYQFSSLILTPVTPLLTWMILNKDYLQVLAPQFASTPVSKKKA